MKGHVGRLVLLRGHVLEILEGDIPDGYWKLLGNVPPVLASGHIHG